MEVLSGIPSSNIGYKTMVTSTYPLSFLKRETTAPTLLSPVCRRRPDPPHHRVVLIVDVFWPEP
jgi:hypothetical protein